MFERLKNIFINDVIEQQNYDFDLDYFNNESYKLFFKENGYVIIKNVVSEQAINKILEAYQLLIQHKDFYEVDGFITSANYGFDIQFPVHQILKDVNKEVLPKIFDTNKIYHNLLNVLVLKFCKDKKEFFPHQDVPLIEENKGHTIFAWIPTEDINENNGSLLVLPKSHKYFRWQHTHDQTHSPLKNLHNEMLKDMTPIFLKKGDLVLFDNALIHASLPNKTDKVRIAMNTGVAINEMPLINYKIIANKKNYIEKYIIDEEFWQKGNFLNPDYVPEKYFPPVIEKIKRIKLYTKKEFLKYFTSN